MIHCVCVFSKYTAVLNKQMKKGEYDRKSRHMFAEVLNLSKTRRTSYYRPGLQTLPDACPYLYPFSSCPTL